MQDWQIKILEMTKDLPLADIFTKDVANNKHQKKIKFGLDNTQGTHEYKAVEI
jgi:hypothetical protein